MEASQKQNGGGHGGRGERAAAVVSLPHPLPLSPISEVFVCGQGGADISGHLNRP